MLLVAAAVVVSVQALGSLLVVAVLVAPAACARLLTHRLAPMLWVSVAVAIAGGAAGLYVSYYAGTAGGASIALCLVGAYLAALAADSARGLRPSTGQRNTCPEYAARRSRSERGGGMSDSVYRVTEIIGTSSDSWEAAGAERRCDRRAYDCAICASRKPRASTSRSKTGRSPTTAFASTSRSSTTRRADAESPPYRRSPVRTRRSARSRLGHVDARMKAGRRARSYRQFGQLPRSTTSCWSIAKSSRCDSVAIACSRPSSANCATRPQLVADDVVVVLAARVRGLVARGAVADVEPVDEAEAVEHLERAVDARDADAGVVGAQLVGDLLCGGAAVLPRERVDHAAARGAGAEALALERRVRVRAPAGVMGVRAHRP